MKTMLTVSFILGLSSMIWARIIANIDEPETNKYPLHLFNYATTGDNAQWEDDKLKRPYSLLEPVVQYANDDVYGFSALVKTIAATLNSPHRLSNPLYIHVPDVSLPFVNNPRSYGFGAANLGIGTPSVKVSGSSLPWDPKTGSFGGWVPLKRQIRRIPRATIMSKKYVNGHLRKVVYIPIPLPHRSVIVIKRKKINYD